MRAFARSMRRGGYCSNLSTNHLSSADPDLVLADRVLDAVLEVRVVVDLHDDDAVVGLLDVDAVEAVADRPRRAHRDVDHLAAAPCRGRRCESRPRARSRRARCLTICQWPRAMRYWQTNSGSPASTPTRQSNSVGRNFCASSRSVSSNSSSAMRRNSSGVCDLVHAARERAVGDLHHQRQAELVHRPRQVAGIGQHHGRRRRHLVRPSSSIRNTLLVQRIIEIGSSMTGMPSCQARRAKR